MSDIDYKKLWEKDEVEIHHLRNRLLRLRNKVALLVANGASAETIGEWVRIENTYEYAHPIWQKLMREFSDDPADPDKLARLLRATRGLNELEDKLGWSHSTSDDFADRFADRMTERHEKAKIVDTPSPMR